MRLARFVFAGIPFALLATVLVAAFISGKWTGKAEEGPEWVFNFKSQDNKLTGTMVGADGKERPIEDGKLDLDTLSFSVKSEWQGTAIKLVMKGKVSSDQIELRVDTDDGAWGTDLILKRASK